MNCYYTSVYFDGKKYHYKCNCGHEVATTDGYLPMEVKYLQVNKANAKIK